jgi:hypothetical protein
MSKKQYLACTRHNIAPQMHKKQGVVILRDRRSQLIVEVFGSEEPQVYILETLIQIGPASKFEFAFIESDEPEWTEIEIERDLGINQHGIGA